MLSQNVPVHANKSFFRQFDTLRFIINGGQIKRWGGGFKDFENLLNGVRESRQNIRGGGWEQNIKENRRK